MLRSLRRRFVVYGYPLEKWMKKYQLKVFSHPCIQCSKPRLTTLPFFNKNDRGLMAPPCSCGERLQEVATVKSWKGFNQ